MEVLVCFVLGVVCAHVFGGNLKVCRCCAVFKGHIWMQ